MGLLFLQAVQNVDIPIMSAYLLLIAFLFGLIMTLGLWAIGVRYAVVIGAGGGSATNDAALDLARRHPDDALAQKIARHPFGSRTNTNRIVPSPRS